MSRGGSGDGDGGAGGGGAGGEGGDDDWDARSAEAVALAAILGDRCVRVVEPRGVFPPARGRGPSSRAAASAGDDASRLDAALSSVPPAVRGGPLVLRLRLAAAGGGGAGDDRVDGPVAVAVVQGGGGGGADDANPDDATAVDGVVVLPSLPLDVDVLLPPGYPASRPPVARVTPGGPGALWLGGGGCGDGREDGVQGSSGSARTVIERALNRTWRTAPGDVAVVAWASWAAEAAAALVAGWRPAPTDDNDDPLPLPPDVAAPGSSGRPKPIRVPVTSAASARKLAALAARAAARSLAARGAVECPLCGETRPGSAFVDDGDDAESGDAESDVSSISVASSRPAPLLSCCGYRACRECLGALASMAVADGAAGLSALRCPAPACRVPLEAPLLRSVLSADDYAAWDGLVLQRALGASSGGLCPRCRGPAELEPGAAPPAPTGRRDPLTFIGPLAQCGLCWHVFCAACRLPDHRPDPCSAALRLVDLDELGGGPDGDGDGLNDDLASAARRRAAGDRLRAAREADRAVRDLLRREGSATRPCPRCAVRITRDGGCMKMSCPSCQCLFCWRCGMDLETPDPDDPTGRPRNPYDHYRVTEGEGGGGCRGRLFDEADVDAWLARRNGGGRANRAQPRGGAEPGTGAADDGAREYVARCPACGSGVARVGNNRHATCSACSTSFCHGCRTVLRGRGAAGRHFGPAHPQHAPPNAPDEAPGGRWRRVAAPRPRAAERADAGDDGAGGAGGWWLEVLGGVEDDWA